MNSFTLTAVGNLAKDPELAVKGDTTYTRFCLVGNDYAGKDEHGNAREAATSPAPDSATPRRRKPRRPLCAVGPDRGVSRLGSSRTATRLIFPTIRRCWRPA